MTVEITTLPTGLRIVTDRIESVETISCGAWVHTGTRNEEAPINGISHMLEHLAFKGTKKRSARQIAEEIESVGGYLNAYTSREVTAYYARCLKNDLPKAIDVLGDILLNSIFDPIEFAREQNVIIQEIGQANDTPEDVAFDLFQSTCYPQQPMGYPILGTEEIVRALTPDVVRTYMQRNYAQHNTVFAAAGNLNHQQVVEWVTQHFSEMTPTLNIPNQPARYQGGVKAAEKDLEQAHIILGFEGVAYQDPLYYALMIYTTVMGGGMSSRLFQEVREKRGLVYSVYASKASFKDTGVFHIYAGTGSQDVTELLPVIRDEMILSQKGFTPAELERAKAQLKAGLMMGMESTSNRCERLANQLLIHERIISASEICEKIDNITNDDIQVVAQYLLSKTMTLVGYGPVQSMPKDLSFQ